MCTIVINKELLGNVRHESKFGKTTMKPLYGNQSKCVSKKERGSRGI